MVLLAWLLTWLMVYSPLDYAQVKDYPLSDAVLCDRGYLAYATWGPDAIRIDMDCLNNKLGLGPWDKVVTGSCLLVHEATHIRLRTSAERPALEAQLACMEKFPWPPHRIVDHYRELWRRTLIFPKEEE